MNAKYFGLILLVLIAQGTGLDAQGRREFIERERAARGLEPLRSQRERLRRERQAREDAATAREAERMERETERRRMEAEPTIIVPEAERRRAAEPMPGVVQSPYAILSRDTGRMIPEEAPAYVVLGVREGARRDEVERAARRAGANYHPDSARVRAMSPADQSDAAAVWQLIQDSKASILGE